MYVGDSGRTKTDRERQRRVKYKGDHFTCFDSFVLNFIQPYWYSGQGQRLVPCPPTPALPGSKASPQSKPGNIVSSVSSATGEYWQQRACSWQAIDNVRSPGSLCSAAPPQSYITNYQWKCWECQLCGHTACFSLGFSIASSCGFAGLGASGLKLGGCTAGLTADLSFSWPRHPYSSATSTWSSPSHCYSPLKVIDFAVGEQEAACVCSGPGSVEFKTDLVCPLPSGCTSESLLPKITELQALRCLVSFLWDLWFGCQ